MYYIHGLDDSKLQRFLNFIKNEIIPCVFLICPFLLSSSVILFLKFIHRIKDISNYDISNQNHNFAGIEKKVTR